MNIANYPSIEQIIAALGKHTDNAETKELLNVIGIPTEDLQQDPDLNDRKLWRDSNHELELDLLDIGSLSEIPYHDIGEGPWVLTDVIFWSEANKNTKQSYGGALPYEINFSMSKKEIQALVSEPRLIDNERVDAWQKDEHEVAINYAPKTNKIRCVSLGIPRPPLSE